MAMKPRHGAALALVIWYLLAPPTALGGLVHNRAPLSKWEVIEVFDTEAKCRTFADIMREEAMTNHPLVAATQARAQAMKCVTSDDPRLVK